MKLGRRTLLLTFALLPLAGGAGRADDGQDGRRDHDRARWAREQGHARSLAEILDEVGDQLGGEVIGVELEEEDGHYLYEFKVITPSGRLREVYVDAMTARVLAGGHD